MRMRRVVVTVALALTAAIGGVAVSTAPASANTSEGYIFGVGDWTNDWEDEGTISSTRYAHSNAAAMWQAILWADGKLSYSGIDCWFGSTTTSATKSWQSAHGLTADGLVGPQTLTRASRHLYASGSQFIYNGDYGSRYITFTRNSDGYWGMYIGSDHHLLGYNYANFDVCT